MNSLKCILLFVIVLSAYQIKGQVKYGAYYFDGWRPNSIHITPKLKSVFSEREPIWGWETSSQEIVDAQIQVAAEAGLRFFSFCWYAGNKSYLENKDNALAYYLNSPYESALEFCLLVANHQGHLITPDNWDRCSEVWLKLFQQKTYLKLGGKPMLIFFSVGSLLQQFGSIKNVKNALEKLRQQALSLQLNGVMFGICTSNIKKEIELAEAMGFDIITQYNNHPIALNATPNRSVDINNLLDAEPKLWSAIKKETKLPVIPTITLNWDPRPWANNANKYDSKPYYTGFNSHSIYAAVINCNRWFQENRNNSLQEKIALIYAWNENGEGAYLTPTKKDGNKKLRALKKAISRNIK